MLDVMAPPRPSRLPGVSMAGFRDVGPGPLDLRAIPHPAVMLAFDFSPGTLVVADASGRRSGGSLVAGLAFGDLRVGGRGIEAVQVRLSPIIAPAVLGIPPAELGGALVDLDAAWGRDATRIRERLSGTGSWPERFTLMDELLARRWEARRSVPPEVARAWDRIVRSGGRIRVEPLAAEVGWSRKRLWSRFRSHIGLTPHRAAKLVRFHHAAHRLAAGHSPAGVAAESGYFDQSHLHRDVRAFTGSTPGRVAAEPFLAVDDVAWPGQAPSVTRAGGSGQAVAPRA